MDKRMKDNSTVGGVVFVGCMFIGLGIGILYNKTAVGVILGLGVGFIVMGAIKAFSRKKD